MTVLAGNEIESACGPADDRGIDKLLGELCDVIGLNDVGSVIRARSVQVLEFECAFETPQADLDALYLIFNFGISTAGRTMNIFQAMLEANLTVYAQDQAQMGLDSDTGCILLLLRVPFEGGIDARWLADTLVHYAEHGRYWRENVFQAQDELFEGLLSGMFEWIRA